MTSDCGCVPVTDYIAGSGWTETHDHAVRGDQACPVCAEFGACEANQRRREAERAWITEYLGIPA